MSDTSAPSFLRRRGGKQPIPNAAALEDTDDPTVIAFLTRVKSTDHENKNLKHENESLKIDRDRDLGRINLLQQELGRVTRARDGYQRAYAEQKAEIAVLITAAKAARGHAYAAIDSARGHAEAAIKTAFDSFLETSDAVLRTIKESLVADGVDPVEPNQGPGQPLYLKDEDLKQLAAHFGADARPPNEAEETRQ